MNGAIKKAKALKLAINKVVSDVAEITSCLQQDATWKPFVGMADDLRNAKARLDQVKNKNAFWKSLILCDTWEVDAKKTTKPAIIINELKHSDVVQTAVTALAEEIATLKGMHDIKSKKRRQCFLSHCT